MPQLLLPSKSISKCWFPLVLVNKIQFWVTELNICHHRLLDRSRIKQSNMKITFEDSKYFHFFMELFLFKINILLNCPLSLLIST